MAKGCLQKSGDLRQRRRRMVGKSEVWMDRGTLSERLKCTIFGRD